jgi:carbamoyl-phosphate synthase large subunit
VSPLRPITVVVTASGAPGTAALLRALRENGEREVRLVGTDMNERSIGRHLCDAFHRVPRGADPEFADAIASVVERERADVVLPQSSHDLAELAAAVHRFEGVAVLVSPLEAIERANDKAAMYELLHRLGIPAPAFRRVRGSGAVESAARELGYPERPVCFKPVFSSGSRGFRVLDPAVDRARQLLEERPGSVAMRLEEALELLPDGGPELLVMELATGGERTIDGIADGREIVLGHPKTRESMRAGLAMYFVTLQDDELMKLAGKIVAALGIEHFFNIQLVGEQVIEVNPRISTIVYQEDLNLPYLGVKRALGEIGDDELSKLRSRIRPGRTALRYFDQLEFDP